MPVATPDELLSALRRSRLVPPDDLAAWLAGQPAVGELTPRALAAKLVTAGLVTAFQAKLLLQGRHKGFFIAGKYKVLDLLGSGGMGAVYLCEHMTLKTPVAVKVLPAAPAENPEARERFYREARAFASLNHPNLVRGFDVDADGKIHFIVMEYVDGVDLQALVARRGPLPAARAANYVRQAAAGLAHAHARGWVHRDIKPANIAVDRAGVARVLDMGLARLVLDGADGITRNYSEGSILGTADYLAPEQATGGAIDGRADIYSLGGTFYFLLSGRLPFGDGNTAQKLVAHQLKAPPPIREVRPDLPAGLAAVIETMMAKRPADRYQTGLDLADALAPWDVGGPFLPAADETPRRLPPGLVAVSAASTPTPGPNTPGRPTAPLAPVAPLVPTAAVSAEQVAAANRAATRALGAGRLPRLSRKGLIGVAGGVAAVALVGAGLIAYSTVNRTPPPRGDGAPAPAARAASPFVGNYVPVTRAHGPRQAPFPGGFTEYLSGPVYQTVAAAMADPRVRERDNCRILLLDEVHEEQAAVDAAGLPPGVSIESARTDKPTQWLPPEVADPARPLLQLTGGTRVVVRNIAFNGMGRVDTVVAWAGPGPGCQLHDVRVTKFARAGVVLDRPAGEADDPVQVSRARVHPDAAAPVDAGVTVRGGAAPARHVKVIDCRLEGPAAVGLVCEGGVEYLEAARCRVFGVQNGVRFAGPGKLRATLAGNTMANVQAGVRVDAAPADGKDGRLVLLNNLFFQAGAAARFGDGAVARAGDLLRGSACNWCDASGCQTPTPGLAVERAPGGLVVGLDPTADADFLRYPAASPLATAGPDHQPVGAPPK